eukprot:8817603-Alexandrium_andersonii.AAC.1
MVLGAAGGNDHQELVGHGGPLAGHQGGLRPEIGREVVVFGLAGRCGSSPGVQRRWRHGREGQADVGEHGLPRGPA